MILAVGLTPAWQQILVLDRLTQGAVNRARRVQWCASGKNINVAMALAALGAEVHSLSFAAGQAGQSIRAELEERGLAADWIETATPTRICTTIVEDSGTTTELVENALAVSQAELDRFLAAYKPLAARAESVVLSGSLPPGTPEDWYSRLLEYTRCPVVLDARGPELLAALKHRPFLVKPNREELGRTVAGQIENDADLLAAMRELNAGGAGWVVITEGASAVWITSREAAYRVEPQSIRPLNAIGSGDCLAAGIAFEIANGAEVPHAVRFGVACGIENALALLPARLDRERVADRASQLVVERLAF